MKTILLMTVLGATPLVTSPAQTAPPAEPRVLAGSAGAKYIRVENMHRARFIEIFLAYRDAKTGKLAAACYNTVLTTGGRLAMKDTAPQAQVEGLDFETMKQDCGVPGASLNGPKLWLPDWTEIDSGVVREFNGLKAAWVATLEQDLIEKPEGGKATIMADEFFNVYDRTGPGMSNYKT